MRIAAPGEGDLTEWASKCLTPITPYFSPSPIFQVVEHSRGNVLVVATNRSFGMVPCIETGKQVYYLRMHDQMLQAPDYLISDLILGRRQHPSLNITNLSLINFGSSHCKLPNDWNGLDVNFELVFSLENESLSWAEDIRLGLISWTKPPNYRRAGGSEQISNYLHSYFELQNPEGFESPPDLVHTVKPDTHRKINMEPFTLQTIRIGGFSIPLREGFNSHYFIWKAAIYLISKGSPPI